MPQLKNTEKAEEYRMMREIVDMLYEAYQQKGDALSWEEFMQAEIALADFAAENEPHIFESTTNEDTR